MIVYKISCEIGKGENMRSIKGSKRLQNNVKGGILPDTIKLIQRRIP